MNRIQHTLCAALVTLLALLNCPASKSATPSVRLDVNWPQFMARQDLVWDKLPEHWYDAAYMGNGMLGLMIYKEPNANYLRFETGNCALHDHRPGSNDLFHACRLLTGHFELHPQGTIVGGQMRLDLWNAETTADIETTAGHIRLRAYVHSDRMIILTQLSTTEGEAGCHWRWVPAPSESPRYLFAKNGGNWIKVPDNYPLNPAPQVDSTQTEGTSVQNYWAGGTSAVAWRETQRGDGRTLWVTLANSYPATDALNRCQKELCSAMRAGERRLERSHRRWWHAYYPASFLTLPDDEVKESFYWIQMYKLASATRGDRALIDCTGPWLTLTPWPNAWWNLNVQLTYWPLNAANRLELAGSLENALYNHTDELRRNVPEPYREGSYALARTSGGDCASELVGIPGVSEAAEVGNLTWACHNLWLIYRHRMDDALLRNKLFPLLRGAVNYYLHFLKEEADGRLHLPTTFSPEYGSAADCHYDLALLRWGCQTLLEAADRLDIDDPLRLRWREVLDKLTPFPQDENGLRIGRDVPYAQSHRHYSHLLAAYPLYLLNRETHADSALISQSLAYWQSKRGAHQGYSLTGAASISAALGRGDEALDYLNGLFGRFLSPTTMYRESGPVIETPLSGAQSMHDMLLQSWGGKVRVFPAVPRAWADVAFYGLLTEGAFRVTASRKGGHTEFIEITSQAGEPLTVVTDIERPEFRSRRTLRVNQVAAHTWKVDLRRNETVVIVPEGASPELVVRPAAHRAKPNPYGLKR